MQQAINAAIKKLLNKSLHGYTFKKQFGEGGQGCVFLAVKDDTQQEYAVKVVPPDFTPGNDAEKVQRAEETYAGNEKLKKNKYLMQYVDHFRENLKIPAVVSCAFLVMELCTGGDLGDLIKENQKKGEKIKKDKFMRLFAQTCVGMYILYINHIMHRDIKAENIFLDGEGNAKIADFGCGKQLSKTFEVTFTNVGIGTMGWVAPEVENQGIYSFPADIWAIGRLFFFLASNSIPNMHPQALPNESKRLVKINPEIPLAVADLLTKMLHSDPSKRPTIKKIVRIPELQEAIRALPADTLPDGLLAHLDSTEDRPDTPPPPPPSSSSSSSTLPPSSAVAEVGIPPPPPATAPSVGVPPPPPAAPKIAAPPSEGELRFRALSDEEFVEIFKVPRAEFLKYPGFKQTRLKKEKKFI